MKFAVESWAPDYGVAADATQMDDASSQVNPSIERDEGAWCPITPAPLTMPERLLFIDGVRRVDANIWFQDGAFTRPGVCASVGAGSVVCAGSEARIDTTLVRRGFFARDSDTAESIVTAHGTYAHVPCKGDSPEEIYLAIHEHMTLCESRVAADVHADLVVYDGPLRGQTDVRAVGYVKTQHRHYLPEDLQPVLGQLEAGQRTPLFLIGSAGNWSRHSWYLRLPGLRTQPLAGIVRLEMSAERSVGDAVHRADSVTAALPRYASQPHKDPRAPQNLYPIAGLEHRLRHLLGDMLVLERALRRSAARMG